jgi:hypothetical protein
LTLSLTCIFGGLVKDEKEGREAIIVDTGYYIIFRLFNILELRRGTSALQRA